MEGKVTGFLRGQYILIASIVLAVISLVFCDDPSDSLNHVDVRTICILFCFMASVAIISGCGAFEKTASLLVSGSGNTRRLCLVLVMLPFVSSMFITNDVALIIFVPLTLGIILEIGRKELVIPVLVLQTVAANLGSMITPFGNPQNLYIFSRYGLGMMDFLTVLLPVFLIGTAIVLIMTYRVGDSSPVEGKMKKIEIDNRAALTVGIILFVVCIATVLRAVPYWITTIIVIIGTLAVMPRALRKVDYGLLLTFLFLFVFTGNISSDPGISGFLGGLMDWNPELASAFASQFISNVPAAVMLSGFTDDWAGLLSGVDIGGFGTPIASMASLITLRLYTSGEDADTKGYLKTFTVVNIIMLATLLVVSAVL